MPVGFIGLGNIGRPMALHWTKGPEPVQVYDLAAPPVVELVAAGATAAATVAELARACTLIGICVRDDRQVQELLYGSGGILENARPDTVVLVHSTVREDSVRTWHRDGAARSLQVVDVPVTRALEPGTFCYMVGGPEALFGRVRAVLTAGGNRAIYAGPVGSGIALKLCNNMMTYAAFIAIHEASTLLRAMGVDPKLLQEVGRVNGVVTAQMSGFLAARDQVAAQGEGALNAAFAPFATLASKDLRCALDSAQTLGVRLPGTRESLALIEDVFLKRY